MTGDIVYRIKQPVLSYNQTNVEAWQFGEEDGYSDACSGLRAKTEFVFPSNWSRGEENCYVDGYTHGFEAGSNFCKSLRS